MKDSDRIIIPAYLVTFDDNVVRKELQGRKYFKKKGDEKQEVWSFPTCKSSILEYMGLYRSSNEWIHDIPKEIYAFAAGRYKIYHFCMLDKNEYQTVKRLQNKA